MSAAISPALRACAACGEPFPECFSITDLDAFDIYIGMYVACAKCGQANSWDSTIHLPDFKWDQLTVANYRVEPTNDILKNDVAAYIRNMHRVRAVPFLIRYMRMATSEFCELTRQTLGDDLNGPSEPDRLNTNEARIRQAMADRAAAWQSLGATTIRDRLTDADLMKWRGTLGVQLAIESLLGSMVIGAWTAFEVLAEDLWVTCLNHRPRLGLVAINAEPDPSDDEQTAERKRNEKFQLPAWLVVEQGFDLNKSMGELLRLKWNFSQRGKPADAYAKVFRGAKADAEAIFDHEPLRHLAQVRNVLVHNAGKADEEFVRNVKGHATLKKVTVGSPILLDGTLISELVAVAVRQSTALIQFVDKWLTDNQK